MIFFDKEKVNKNKKNVPIVKNIMVERMGGGCHGWRSNELNPNVVYIDRNTIKTIVKENDYYPVCFYSMFYFVFEPCLYSKEQSMIEKQPYKNVENEILRTYEILDMRDGVHYCRIQNEEILNSETIEFLTPLEVFKEIGHFCLIETEEEFEKYLNSDLSVNEWCRKKLVSKMIELNLGEGFINAFARKIGNDLERYKTLIRLSNECENRDILMYLLVESFGDKHSRYQKNINK